MGKRGGDPGAGIEPATPDMLTRYGFTSVFDLASMWTNTRLRERIESGEVMGPRIGSVGEGILPKGGLPPDIVPRMMGWMIVPLPEVMYADEAPARKLLDAGVDAIKTFASAQQGMSLPESAIRAAADDGNPKMPAPIMPLIDSPTQVPSADASN
jgi:hypothetical protein